MNSQIAPQRKNTLVMHMTRLFATLLAVALFATTTPAAAADAPSSSGDAGPFAAHNAYPYRLYAPKRFERALDAGLKYVELDITYDPKKNIAVVTHDSKPRGRETALSAMLDELWSRWTDAPADDYTVILDFKTSSPELVQCVQDLLTPQAEHLSKLQDHCLLNRQQGCASNFRGSRRRGGRLSSFWRWRSRWLAGRCTRPRAGGASRIRTISHLSSSRVPRRPQGTR